MTAGDERDPALVSFQRDALADPQRTLLALDVDGTVSPIVASPGGAAVPEPVRSILSALSERYRVWFISGRDAEEARRIVGVLSAGYIGGHGLELLDERGRRDLVPIGSLRQELQTLAGAVVREVEEVRPYVEWKRWGVAFHYRAFGNSAAIAERLRRSIEARLTPNLRLRSGKMVLEVAPDVAQDKGSALLHLIGEFAPKRVLAVGDDLTDIAMFEALTKESPRRGIAALRVAVLHAGETPGELLAEADITVNGVSELMQFLENFLPPAD